MSTDGRCMGMGLNDIIPNPKGVLAHRYWALRLEQVEKRKGPSS